MCDCGFQVRLKLFFKFLCANPTPKCSPLGRVVTTVALARIAMSLKQITAFDFDLHLRNRPSWQNQQESSLLKPGSAHFEAATAGRVTNTLVYHRPQQKVNNCAYVVTASFASGPVALVTLRLARSLPVPVPELFHNKDRISVH
jgi:hypothetical protein